MGVIFDRFEIRFRKVVDYWTIDAFPEAHRDRVMYRTNDLSQAEVEELNNIILDHCEKAPSIVKIVGYASVIRAKRKNYVADLASVIIPCQQCDGDGLLSAYKIIDDQQYFFSFRCPSDTCEYGKRLACQKTQQWTEELRKEFMPKWEYTKKLNAADVVAAAKKLKSMGFNVPSKYLGENNNGKKTSTSGREDQTGTPVQVERRTEGSEGRAGGIAEQEASRGRREEEGGGRQIHREHQESPESNP